MRQRLFILCVLCLLCLYPGTSLGSKQSLGDDVKQFQKQQADKLKSIVVQIDPSEEGVWPMDRTSECQPMLTRDRATDKEIAAAVGPIQNTAECGINMYMDPTERSTRQVKRSQEDSLADETEQFLELLLQSKTELVELLKEDGSKSQSNKHFMASKSKTGEPEVDQFLAKLMDLADNVNQRQQQKRDFVSLDSAIEAENELQELEAHVVNDPQELEARVVGGHETREAQFPWLIALGHKESGLSCGGTLINSRWVVTASHCIDERIELCDYNIRLGSTCWYQDSSGHHIDVEPEKIIMHKYFDPDFLINDIALIKLSRDVPLNPSGFINSICLPRQDSKTTVGTVCTAAGWGLPSEGASGLVSNYEAVDLPVLRQKDCNYEVTDSQMCAGSVEGGIDTCQGDSGGPLMHKENDKWYLTGITSFGYGCGRAKWPGIYTDVSSHIDYISSVINRYS